MIGVVLASMFVVLAWFSVGTLFLLGVRIVNEVTTRTKGTAYIYCPGCGSLEKNETDDPRVSPARCPFSSWNP